MEFKQRDYINNCANRFQSGKRNNCEYFKYFLNEAHPSVSKNGIYHFFNKGLKFF